MLRPRVSTIVAVLLATQLTDTVRAEPWPAWRGAAGRGVSTETNLPQSWSEDENLAWSIDLPGHGNSSPAVTSDRVYLTTQTDDGTLSVLAFDRADGRRIWQRDVGRGELAAFGPKNLYAHRHNAATPSPTADAQHVWAYFGSGLLVCLTADGETLWRRDLAKDYGAYRMRFGMASAPRLWGELIYVACMHDAPSYVVALDKRTGREVWKQPRLLPAADDGPQAYSTPVVWHTADRTELLISGSDHVNAYDPLTGRQLWVSGGLKIDSQFGRIIASPAVSDDVVVVCSANPPGSTKDRAIALRTGGQGDVTKTHRLWDFRPFNPDCSTPVCYGENVYMVRDDGIAVCLDLKTGELRWRQRLPDGTYRAALVAGDGKVYTINREGLCVVIAADTAGKILAKNQLPGTFYATPAISDGQVFLRAYERLYAVGARRP